VSEKVPDFVVFDGRDITKVVYIMRQLQQNRRLTLSEMKNLAEVLEVFLSEGIEVTAEQLRKGTK